MERERGESVVTRRMWFSRSMGPSALGFACVTVVVSYQAQASAPPAPSARPIGSASAGVVGSINAPLAGEGGTMGASLAGGTGGSASGGGGVGGAGGVAGTAGTGSGGTSASAAGTQPTATSTPPSIVGHIPSFLGALGVMNTILVFLYSSVLNRVAMLSQRKLIPWLFGGVWAALVCLLVAYGIAPWLPGGCLPLAYFGLFIWMVAFAAILVVTRQATLDSVHQGEKLDPSIKFEDRFSVDDFGVEVMDRTIRLAKEAHRPINYPMLIISDFQSPGRSAALRFLRRGLSGGEGAIYFSFSRPHTTILEQISHWTPPETEHHIWIIDCYSKIYLPEDVPAKGDKRPKPGGRSPSTGEPAAIQDGGIRAKNAGSQRHVHVSFADARNPSSVYTEYAAALLAARQMGLKGVRTVYETLSDFIKIADVDLVLHYLRRVVVLEEKRKIRALYLFWHESVQGGVDQRYLQWFFNATITLTKRTAPGPCIDFQIDHLLRQRVRLATDVDLQYRKSLLFKVDLDRVAAVARALVALSFRPRPYGFLPSLRGAPGYREHLVNFLFYMVAIDHDTHLPDARYEDVVDGMVVHGSDLLYRQAGEAKAREPQLFRASSFASISDEEVAAIFKTPSGKLPADVKGRADIFRTCAVHLQKEYEGDAVKLLNDSQQTLEGPGGLLERLRQFRDYADPVGKKSYLLVKVLRREGQYEPKDTAAIRASIDHVVMTIALRSGMVACEDPEVLRSLQAGSQLDAHQEGVLREVTAEAVTALAKAAKKPEDEIDDLIWSYGRKSLLLPTPLDASKVHSELDGALGCGEGARVAFVEAMNGVGLSTHSIPTVRIPFTRFY
jgi:hypothetical protein